MLARFALLACVRRNEFIPLTNAEPVHQPMLTALRRGLISARMGVFQLRAPFVELGYKATVWYEGNMAEP